MRSKTLDLLKQAHALVLSGKEKTSACKSVGVSVSSYWRWENNMTQAPDDKVLKSERARAKAQLVFDLMRDGMSVEKALAQAGISHPTYYKYKPEMKIREARNSKAQAAVEQFKKICIEHKVSFGDAVNAALRHHRATKKTDKTPFDLSLSRNWMSGL